MEPDDPLETALAQLRESLADLATLNNIVLGLRHNAARLLGPLATTLHESRDAIDHALTLIEGGGGRPRMKSKAFDHNDVRSLLLQARAVIDIAQLATQATDELDTETIYSLMRALEGILDAALEGLQPLMDDEDRRLLALMRAPLLPAREGSR